MELWILGISTRQWKYNRDRTGRVRAAKSLILLAQRNMQHGPVRSHAFRGQDATELLWRIEPALGKRDRSGKPKLPQGHAAQLSQTKRGELDGSDIQHRREEF